MAWYGISASLPYHGMVKFLKLDYLFSTKHSMIILHKREQFIVDFTKKQSLLVDTLKSY